VPHAMAGSRLDVYLSGEFKDQGLSRSKIQQLIKAGKVTVDGTQVKQPKLKLSGGERVECAVELDNGVLTPEEGALEIHYEDEQLVVVNKEAGLTVHPAPSQRTNTLVQRMLSRYPQLGEMEGERPGIVHRIDKDTSGIMVVALDEATRLAVAEDFAERRIHKEYLALVHGVPQCTTGQKEGEITAPIGRDPKHKTKMAVMEKGGREARSAWRVLWTSPDESASLVRVKIFTGRTHQIRVHMAHIGHPLLGDQVYGARLHKEWCRKVGNAEELAPRQMLHAWHLSLTHPKTGKLMDWKQAPPEDFQRLLLHLGQQVQRIGVIGMPGCGKSALNACLEHCGCPVFSADAEVAAQYEAGGDAWTLIRQRFGERFAPEGESVAKRELFAAMKDSEVFRKELQAIVHPLVEHAAEEFFAEHAAKPCAVAEVPLLIEGQWKEQGRVDLVVGVRCDEDQRRQRLVARGWDDETIATVESWQWKAEDKLARCDEIVENSGTLEDLQTQAAALCERLAARRAEQKRVLQARFEKLWSA